MPPQRRVWDSSVVLGFLAGQPDIQEACAAIIDHAERGEIEIVISAMAAVEVAYLEGRNDRDSERTVREFLASEYIVLAAVDVRIASLARDLVRRHRREQTIKPADAIHLATAIHLGIPILETTDKGLLRFDGQAGSPSVNIRRPFIEASHRMPGM